MLPAGVRIVDGERFDVRPRDDGSGTYDCDWLTGPNHGYGLSIGAMMTFVADRYDGHVDTGITELTELTELTEDGLVSALQRFLGSIDPGTGYLAESAEPPDSPVDKGF